MTKKAKKLALLGAALMVLGFWVFLDISRKPVKEINEGRIFTVAPVSAVAGPGQSVVAIVRSDNPALEEPANPDSALSYEQVEDMVRYAVALAGGLQTIIEPDDDWIVIKPNVVEPYPSGSGVVTDWRVVKAVVKLVHEIVPDAKVTVAEGPGGWISPGYPETKTWFRPVDGFELVGYKALLSDPELSDVNLDIVDINFDDTVEMPVPGGGYARNKYFLPKTILDCDVLISVPVMKVHPEAGITVAMKNMVGIAPGMKYGWAKFAGYPRGSGNPGLPHSSPVIDEMIVDLNLLAGVDFSVVDAVMAMERSQAWGNPVRMNMIIAGSDVVAVDAVCTRIMGFNPDDFEQLTLGACAGLGIVDLDSIKVKGDKTEEVARRFEKAQRWTCNYGQSNRVWILKGPFKAKDPEEEFIDVAGVKPIPGKNGWSEPIYFHHDKIDLGSYYGNPTECVVYAFTEFTAPKSQETELWVGSGETMKAWINGEEVYSFKGVRRHHLPNNEEKIKIRDGRNSLLVKVGQTTGRFDFSLNVCELEEDDRYDGNRVLGLKFSPPAGIEVAMAEVARVRAPNIEDFAFGEEMIVNKMEGFDPIQAGISAKEKMVLEGFPRLEKGLSPMTFLKAVLEYKGEEITTDCLIGTSGMAFRFYYNQRAPWRGVHKLPESPLKAICKGLGYSYAYSYNEDTGKAWTRLKGWISGGYPVIPWPVSETMEGVIVGYEDKDQTIVMRTMRDPTGEYSRFFAFSRMWGDEWEGKVTPQFVVGQKVKGLNDREIALMSFQRAIELAKGPDIIEAEGDTTFCGFTAYEKWLEDLAGELRYEDLSLDQRRIIIAFDGYFLPSLITDRKAAAKYLKSLSGQFNPPDRARIVEASKRYKAIGKRLAKVKKLLPQGDWEEGDFSEKERKKFGNRKQVARLVAEAYELEKQVIGLLEEVVGDN